jgi:type IV pilus assembly protein PilQ
MKLIFLLLACLSFNAFTAPIITGSNDCVTVDFSSIPLSEAVAFYAKTSGQNFVLDSSIKSSIDLHLNCVKLSSVLDALLLISGGVVDTKNGITYILPKSPLLPESQSHNLNSSNIESKESKEQKPLDYSKLVKIYNSLSAELLPLIAIDDLTIKSFDSANSLYLLGTHESVEKAIAVITSLDKPKKQYMVKAKLIATSDVFIEDLGVSLGANLSTSSNQTALTSAFTTASAVLTGGTSLIVQKAGSVLLTAKISAAVTDGEAAVLSEPQTIAYDNKESSITQGLRIPYQTQLPQGGFQVSFIDAALSLKVTPRRGDAADRIILDVYFSKNSAGVSSPAGIQIETREIKTTVSLRSGETVMLGGIDESSTDSTDTGIPYLRDIPVLGYAFGSTLDNAKHNKIILMITPTMI